jgi:hypothetical protein
MKIKQTIKKLIYPELLDIPYLIAAYTAAGVLYTCTSYIIHISPFISLLVFGGGIAYYFGR